MCDPLITYLGSKRKHLKFIKTLLPQVFDVYIEPFIGSGALFFHLQPKKAVIGDKNIHLINMYQMLQQDWQTFKQLYTQIATQFKSYNSTTEIIKQKFKTILLEPLNNYRYLPNQSLHSKPTHERMLVAVYYALVCNYAYRGVVRETEQGLSTTPVVRKTSQTNFANNTIDIDKIEPIGRYLSDNKNTIDILLRDYRQTIHFALNKYQEGTIFAFLDPPYFGTKRIYLNCGFDNNELFNYLQYQPKRLLTLISQGDRLELRELFKNAKISEKSNRSSVSKKQMNEIFIQF